MNDIIKWIKSENLWFCIGYRITHNEFDAEIWCHTESNLKLKTIGWWGKGDTLEKALNMAYLDCKEKLSMVKGRIK